MLPFLLFKLIVKVRFFRGGTIEEMEDNTKAILKREPDYIILNVRISKAPNLTARDILARLLQLKSKILDALQLCKVIILQRIIRSDIKVALTTTFATC